MILLGSAAVGRVPRQAQELRRAALGCSVRGDKRASKRCSAAVAPRAEPGKGSAGSTQLPWGQQPRRPVRLQLQLALYAEYYFFFFFFGGCRSELTLLRNPKLSTDLVKSRKKLQQYFGKILSQFSLTSNIFWVS